MPKTILLVDDDHAVRRSFSRLLHINGYTVVQAGTYLEALDILKSNETISAIVTDFDLGTTQNGGDICWVAKQHGIKPRIVFTADYFKAKKQCEDAANLVVDKPNIDKVLAYLDKS